MRCKKPSLSPQERAAQKIGELQKAAWKDSLFQFFSIGVAMNDDELDEICETGEEVEWEEISRKCDAVTFSKVMGYADTQELRDDAHIGFWKSELRGKTCYSFICENIEYVFCKGVRVCARG